MTDSVQPLAGMIRRELERWNLGAIEESVIGTADPEAMAEVFDRYCRHHLGSDPVGGLFYLGSAGCVVGLRLESGDEVVVKAYQERWTAPYLRAVQSVQRHLCASGFPCPHPLAPPRRLQLDRPNLAVVESFLTDPGMEPLRGSDICRHSAAGLARQIALCRTSTSGETLAEHPLRTPAGRLYPEPHSPLFDFEKSSARAGWIDRYAERASVLREADHSSPVTAHTDWSARNVRFGPGGLVAAYDWDSLALVPESTAVGQAAATWSVTSEPGGSEFPSLESITEFVVGYEEAGGRRFDDVQWRATGAAAAYVLAYTARCEDSLETAGLARPHQRGGRDRLADAGEHLLAFARP
jgi:Phosphotransferase enzyme family